MATFEGNSIRGKKKTLAWGRSPLLRKTDHRLGLGINSSLFHKDSVSFEDQDLTNLEKGHRPGLWGSSWPWGPGCF